MTSIIIAFWNCQTVSVAKLKAFITLLVRPDECVVCLSEARVSPHVMTFLHGLTFWDVLVSESDEHVVLKPKTFGLMSIWLSCKFAFGFTLLINSAMIHFVSVHLACDQYTRALELEGIMDTMATLKISKVIIGGDFNQIVHENDVEFTHNASCGDGGIAPL